MLDILETLIGRRIECLKYIHDYAQLCFFDRSILNIFNRYVIRGVNDAEFGGYEIADVRHGLDGITLALHPKGIIFIGLEESDYHGPEAIQYIAVDGSAVIWS